MAGGRAVSVTITASTLAILGVMWKGADYLGHGIYEFAQQQTQTNDRLKDLTQGLRNLNTALAESRTDQNQQRDKSIADLKTDLVPRIEKLESAVTAAVADSAVTNARVQASKETLDQILNLGQENLRVSQSHTPDIRATRKALDPTHSGP